MTLMDSKKEFPDWDSYYNENDVEKMPWYEKNLDPDLEYEIKTRKLHTGKFLDLGTGPGTQAIQLANLGFKTTGSDLSENAILKAKKLSSKVNFVKDDFLKSQLPDEEFDYIFDRGCFHVFEPQQRADYINQILRVLTKNGIYFLKCMSNKEKDLPDDKGPHKFSQQEIRDIFSNDFQIDSIKYTVYHGTLSLLPKAMFVVLRKKT